MINLFSLLFTSIIVVIISCILCIINIVIRLKQQQLFELNKAININIQSLLQKIQVSYERQTLVKVDSNLPDASCIYPKVIFPRDNDKIKMVSKIAISSYETIKKMKISLISELGLSCDRILEEWLSTLPEIFEKISSIIYLKNVNIDTLNNELRKFHRNDNYNKNKLNELKEIRNKLDMIHNIKWIDA